MKGYIKGMMKQDGETFEIDVEVDFDYEWLGFGDGLVDILFESIEVDEELPEGAWVDDEMKREAIPDLEELVYENCGDENPVKEWNY